MSMLIINSQRWKGEKMIGNRQHWQLPVKSSNITGHDGCIHYKAKFHYFTNENESLCGKYYQVWYAFETYPTEKDWKDFDDSYYCSSCLKMLKKFEGCEDENETNS